MTELPSEKITWTIGHSTRTWEEFISMLQSFRIECLIDIRNFPGSKRYPHFNKDQMEKNLPSAGIQYFHLKDLGGRRKPLENSENTAWQHPAFRGYADYMETETFKKAILVLEEKALQLHTAYMCSEAVWWRCHRALVSDFLKARGWKVMHIMGNGKSTEHPFTSAARMINGELTYKYHGHQLKIDKL
jgi:uncharacterized protein (DUF488 family)